jgi:small neutral amino acid transporter SnatA (MarC family)
MMGAPADVFVGSVAVGLGLFFLLVALFNWEWYFSVRSARLVGRLLGRTGARIFYMLLGAGLVTLGIAIACGFGPNKGG